MKDITIYNTRKSRLETVRFEFTAQNTTWFDDCENIEAVKTESAAWQESRNNKGAKVNWQFRSEDARVKLKRLYPTLNS